MWLATIWGQNRRWMNLNLYVFPCSKQKRPRPFWLCWHHIQTLQHTAVCCSVWNDPSLWLCWRQKYSLQHTATHCSTLQHAAAHCNTLQHTATHYKTLQYTASHCNTLQCEKQPLFLTLSAPKTGGIYAGSEDAYIMDVRLLAGAQHRYFFSIVFQGIWTVGLL